MRLIFISTLAFVDITLIPLLECYPRLDLYLVGRLEVKVGKILFALLINPSMFAQVLFHDAFN